MVENPLSDAEYQSKIAHDTLDHGVSSPKAGLIWTGCVLMSLFGFWCLGMVPAHSAERAGSATVGSTCKLLVSGSDTGWSPPAGASCDAACDSELSRRREIAAPIKTSGSVRYTCRNDRSTTVSYQPNPATCPGYGNLPLTKPGVCPPNTSGTWTQNATYTQAPPPDCTVTARWTPETPPPGSCTATPPANRPPTISGTPPSSIPVGGDFYFLPTASDPDRDAVTFSCAGCPSWVTFRPTDGRMTGIPQEAGNWSAVTITARDARGATSSLQPFTVTVNAAPVAPGTATLSWTAPTHNTNGTVLSNLAGYRISYGESPSAMARSVQIANAGVSRYTVTNLPSGTYYFVVRAYTVGGTESGNSNTVSKVVR